MRHIHTLLLLLLSLTTFAQVDVHIPNSGNAATQEWVKVYLQDWLSRLKDKEDTTSTPTDPGTGTPCNDLNLTSVSQVQNNQLTFAYTGALQTINWTILSGTTPVRTGGVVPTSQGGTEISFAALNPGSYKFKIDATNCTTSKSIEFTIIGSAPSCGTAPYVISIPSYSQTSLTFIWSALNVPEIIWNIRQNNANIRSGSFIPGTSSTQTISYNTLPYGSYELQLVGLTCATIQSPAQFTINAPPITPTGKLIVSGYYGRETGADFKTRIDNGDPPYSITVRNFADNIIHSVSGVRDDEIKIPNNALDGLNGGLKISVTDSRGETGTANYDNGTLYAMKRLFVGFSVADGDASNHVNKIIEGNSRGFSGTGVIFENGSIQTDADLVALENAPPFDHTQPLGQNGYEFTYDKTIKALMEANTATLLRINLHLKRTYGILNNGSTRTAFVGISDSQMRPDGVTPIAKAKGGDLSQYFDIVMPSYASQQTLSFAKRFYTAIVKRYINQINSGRVIAVGIIVTTSGEGEISFKYQIGESDLDSELGSTSTHGDFHPSSMALFKQRFPQYNSLNGIQIATAAYNSQLAIDWAWHNNQLIIDFERNLLDHIYNNVPQLTRTKIYQVDSGSLLDHLAFARKTLNATERADRRVMLWKQNDASNNDAETVRFFLDHLSSMARRSGGIAIVEPSPPVYEAPEYFGGIVFESNEAALRGIGTSYYTPNGGLASNLLSQSVNATPNGIPINKDEFKLIDGYKRLQSHKINISKVLVDGGFGGSGAWKNAWQSFKNSNGLGAVNTTSVDDVKGRVSP